MEFIIKLLNKVILQIDKTSLHLAAEKGNFVLVKILLEQDGININAKNEIQH